MESEDGSKTDMDKIVQDFLKTLLDEVIRNVEELQRKESVNIVHDIIIDALQKAVEIAEENKEIFSCEIRENDALTQIPNGKY